MKKLLMAAALAAMATGASAEDVKLQLKWVTQAQFAGYYVAQAKGYYEEEGLNVTILPGGVTVLKQGFNVDPLLQKQAACISTMTYNEYWQVIDAGITPEQLVTFKYQDMGVATLEDGLYVLEDRL